MECGFCKLKIKNEKILETKFFYSILDIHPVSPGHALVIPKRHIVSLLDLSDREWLDLRDAIKETIKIIENSDLKDLYKKLINKKLTEKSPNFCKKMLEHKSMGYKPEGYNIGNNEGESAGRIVHHLHIHIIPRYKGDVKDYIGGIRHIIPGMGNYK
jgi:histidine triad (HIT) family protein